MSEAHPTRQKLIEQGLLLAQEKGLRGLAVREVAKRAGVNPGSFVYHFGTREAFVAELVEIWYAPMYEELRLASVDARGNGLDRLRAALEQLLTFIEAQAGFVAHLVADAVAGEVVARAFLMGMPTRHPALLLRLLEEAQREGSLISGPPIPMMMFIMAAAGLPMVLGRGPLQRLDWIGEGTAPFLDLLGDPQLARQRLEWAFKGLTPSRGDA